jgi:hypothetical protein
VVVHASHPSYGQKENRIGLGKKQDPISKISRAKNAGGVTQAVEHLPSKCKVLSSYLNTAQKKD